jgi:hypothetical protein
MVGFAPKSLCQLSFIAIEISARAVSMILPPLHALQKEKAGVPDNTHPGCR